MKRKLMSKIIILIILSIMFALPFAIHVKGISNKKESIKVVVYPGDTLWSIAAEKNSGYRDVRQLIYEIRKINNLKSPVIYPGQELEIPIK
ncbi:cell division suppressor protein YneA [Fonticella tunisiensis]|uniref:LysM domain-containing protein n=1 Tax=Fonticella tunisiensis TaxID=1096341 RepID=A0A4R7KTP6_9CLOT|nr:LysM peptidoglycan-binding domain-containing protein [Fonticella tunisiensis]TDT61533.1 LysM domain-containing protein [Fonticella tunisiensis]